MIEEVDDRFTEDTIAQLLEAVSTELPDHSAATTSEEQPMETGDGCSRDVEKEDSIATAEP